MLTRGKRSKVTAMPVFDGLRKWRRPRPRAPRSRAVEWAYPGAAKPILLG